MSSAQVESGSSPGGRREWCERKCDLTFRVFAHAVYLSCPSLTNSLSLKISSGVISKDLLPSGCGPVDSPSAGPLPGLLA